MEQLFINNSIVFAARISKVENLTLEKTMDAFQWADRFIVSQEGQGKGLHQHLLISTSDTDRKQILLSIKDAYPEAKGNKCIYVKPAENPTQLLKYTIKEGSFLYRGLTKAFLQRMALLSSPKTDVKQKVTDLEDKLILKEITWRQFITQHIQLKVDHQQNLYDNHLVAYFKRMALKAGELSVDDYCQRLEERIFF